MELRHLLNINEDLNIRHFLKLETAHSNEVLGKYDTNDFIWLNNTYHHPLANTLSSCFISFLKMRVLQMKDS